MHKYIKHLFHPERVHHTALWGFLIALSMLGLDLAMADVAHAPTILSAILHPLTSGIQVGNAVVIPTTHPYIEVTEGCGPYYGGGTCVNMRSGPGTEYPSILKLRTGIVLRVADATTDSHGQQWFRIAQDSSLRFADRITSDWYVAASAVHLFYDDGDHTLEHGAAVTTSKHILVDLSDEMLYAYEGDTLFMQESISRGLDNTPTPIGTFTIYKMTPSRYMQGPIEGVSDQYYDLPGVPWNLYFTTDGAVIHGAYWHDHFGHPWSHGCINLPPDKARELYLWASVGIKVTVQE